MKPPPPTRLPSGTYTGQTFGDLVIEDATVTLTGCTWHSLSALNSKIIARFCSGKNIGRNFALLDKCFDCLFDFCEVLNTPSLTTVEDIINFFGSTRCTASNCFLEGATPSPGFSGSGIMFDRYSSKCVASYNVVSNTQNAGIGVAGGTDHLVIGNRVGAQGIAGCNGNVGIYFWRRYAPDPYGLNVGRDNAVCWKTRMGRNDYWIDDGVLKPVPLVKLRNNSSLPTWDRDAEHAEWMKRKMAAMAA